MSKVKLVCEIAGTGKFYMGQVTFREDTRITAASVGIIANDTEDAKVKLKEYILQEHPSVDWKTVNIGVFLTFMLI